MRKNQVEKYTLKSLFFLGLLFLVFTCQKEETSNGKDESINIQEPEITTIENFGHTDSRFNSLKEALNIDVYLKSKFAIAQSRTTQDTLGLTIATDIIKQVTLGDYTSYTMEVVQETDSTVFYNLTIEYKNGETGMFVTKYTPTQYWLDNTNESYQGDIETARINELTEYTDIDQAFDEDLVGGDNNTDLGSGVGGSNDNYTPQGSPYYPTDCGGVVVITMNSVPYPCGCGDWPGGNCQGCDNSSPMFPGYTQVPYYTCIDYGYGDPVDGNTDTTSGGQTLEVDDPSEDDGSISVLINSEEEQTEEKSKTDCQSLKQLVATDSLGSNILPTVNELRNKLNIGNKEWSVGYWNRWVNGVRKNVIDDHGMREGISDTRSKITVGTTNVGQIHTHPEGKYAIFSWLDLRAIKLLHTNCHDHFKNDIFLIAVAPNNLTYALRVEDISILVSKINEDMSNFEGGSDEEKRERLMELMINEYKKYDNEEFAFLSTFSDYGISLYKATDENLTNWKQLKLSEEDENTINETPCE